HSGSFAWGGWTEALNGSVAIGLGAKATGRLSFAQGEYAHAQAPHSVAIGNSVRTQGYAQVVIGYYNKLVGDPFPTSSASSYPHPKPDSPIFVIGNGKRSAAGPPHDQPSNALTVAYNGATRINGTLTVRQTIRVAPGGDLPMGEFTAGSNPLNESY
ncbi:MAG: hypothetical protein NZL93_01685, partial [Chthoniobacterales bacterium]|nr:hypothetical protein [Chthoniobacterales bacterium]